MCAEYGVCPQYKVVEGDTLFEIAKKLNVDQGEGGRGRGVFSGGTRSALLSYHHGWPVVPWSRWSPVYGRREQLYDGWLALPTLAHCRCRGAVQRASLARGPPPPPPPCVVLPAAAALTASVQACGVDISLLQIGSSICLPGYDTDLCMDIVRTGETSGRRGGAPSLRPASLAACVPPAAPWLLRSRAHR